MTPSRPRVTSHHPAPDCGLARSLEPWIFRLRSPVSLSACAAALSPMRTSLATTGDRRCRPHRPTPLQSCETVGRFTRGYLRRGSTGGVELVNEVHLGGVNCVATVRICSLMSFWRNPGRTPRAGARYRPVAASSIADRACGRWDRDMRHKTESRARDSRQKPDECRDCLGEGYARPEAARR